ncbi:MAG: epoxide hydrolase family protein [Streptosporangiaceae bacterium]
MTDQIESVHLAVTDAELADLHERLSRVRWPEGRTVTDTSQGPTTGKLRALIEHWRDNYDWRRCETELNDLGQFRTTIDGPDIDFLHIRSPEPNALPLLMTHGWPGSVLEFRKVIGPLTDPVAHGGHARDAFHLVLPTLPGFGFSVKPAQTGWNMGRIADAWITLMDRLGYDRWAAQGGDLGCGVTDEIARRAPAGLIGMHLNFAMFGPTPDEIADATADEQAMLGSAKYFWDNLRLRQRAVHPPADHRLLPRRLPVGLAAWIYAMFQDTCGTPGDAEDSFTLDEMLDDIMLYWLPNSATSAARLVSASHDRQPDHPPGRVHYAPERARPEVAPLARTPLQQHHLLQHLLQRASRRRPLHRSRAARRIRQRRAGNIPASALTRLRARAQHTNPRLVQTPTTGGDRRLRRSKTPACSRGRQRVCPEPDPSSGGGDGRARSLCRAYRWRTSRSAAASVGPSEIIWVGGTAVCGTPPLRDEVVRPAADKKGKDSTHPPPLSTYSAPGGLRQDPGRAA